MVCERDTYVRLLKCLEVFDDGANVYSRDICKSFITQNKKHDGLTARQMDILATWEETTGSRELYDEWKQKYSQDAEIRQTFSSCVEFHGTRFSFSVPVNRYKAAGCMGIDFVPAKNIYDMMTTDKRFLVWRHNTTSIPRFSKGDLVEGRKTSRHHRDYTYIITEVKDEYDYCKDGRWYVGHIAARPDEKPHFTSYWRTPNTTSRTFREKDVKVFRRNSR